MEMRKKITYWFMQETRCQSGKSKCWSSTFQKPETCPTMCSCLITCGRLATALVEFSPSRCLSGLGSGVEFDELTCWGEMYQRFLSYFWTMKSFTFCSSFESGSAGKAEFHSPSQTFLQYCNGKQPQQQRQQLTTKPLAYCWLKKNSQQNFWQQLYFKHCMRLNASE